jgi:enamine deaminase RidA (YjgF/YER057c/UK114 family)
MKIRTFEAPDGPKAVGGYSQVCEVSGHQRLVFVSGQIPESVDGHVPRDFPDQCRLVWANIEAQLRAADMGIGNIVKVTTFLSDRRYAADNRVIRGEVLGDHRPAMSVIITSIFDSAWLLEIEVIAAA